MTNNVAPSSSLELPDEESIRGATVLSDVILQSMSQSEYSSDGFITDDEYQRAISQAAGSLRKGFFQPVFALQGLRLLASQLRTSSREGNDLTLRKGIDKHITYVLQHGLIQDGATAHVGDAALLDCMELIASLCEEFIEIEYMTSRALDIALKMALYLPELSEPTQREHIYQGTIYICQRSPKVALKLLERVTRTYTRLLTGPTGRIQDQDYCRVLFLSHVIQLLVDAAPEGTCTHSYQRLTAELSAIVTRLSPNEVVLIDVCHTVIEALEYKLTNRAVFPSSQTDTTQHSSQSQSQSMASDIRLSFTPESSEFSYSLSDNDASGTFLHSWLFNKRSSQ